MKTLRILAGGSAYGQGFYIDEAGYWSFGMGENDVQDFTIDWTGWLEGDTISTSLFTPTSLTENSESNTTTSATCFVTSPDDPYGYTANTITTAAGRTKKMTVRVYQLDV